LSGRNIGIGFLGLVALGIVARIFYPTSDPVVAIAPEAIPGLGFFTNSMLTALILDVILILIAVLATRKMQLVPRGLQNVMEAIIEALYKLFKGVNATHVASTFPLVATIFLYVIVANVSGLFPGVGSIGFCTGEEHASSNTQLAVAAPEQGALPGGMLAAEEGEIKYLGCPPDQQHLVPFWRPPSTDLSFTLAITVLAWLWIQYLAFKALGAGYLKKYFISPAGKLSDGKGPIMTIVGLLELISLLARLPAFAFRLFGNIFAGEVLLIVMIFLLPLGLPLPIYLFEVFVAFIQAFIFAVLVMAFISIDTKPHEGEHGAH
jgi:F-type H+-transporting ATPase subunit a